MGRKYPRIGEIQVFCQMLMGRTEVYSQPYYNDRNVNAECFVIASVIEWLM